MALWLSGTWFETRERDAGAIVYLIPSVRRECQVATSILADQVPHQMQVPLQSVNDVVVVQDGVDDAKQAGDVTIWALFSPDTQQAHV